MTENLPSTGFTGWLAGWIANGKIPGATKAIAQLVGDVANVGSAWVNIGAVKGAQIQERIKADTEATKAITAALGAAAAKQGADDPRVVQLALQQLASSSIRKHLNKQAVVEEAVRVAEAAGEPSAPPDDLEDDWLNRFERLAEDATSERVRQLLGRVLGGEIRAPGTFSFQTLNILSVLDKQAIEDIAAIGCYVFDGTMIPFPDRFDFKAEFHAKSRLIDLGLLGDTQTRRFVSDDHSAFRFQSGLFAYIVNVGKGITFEITYTKVTQPGMELFPLIVAKNDIEVVKDTTKLLLQISQVITAKSYLCQSAAPGSNVVALISEEKRE